MRDQRHWGGRGGSPTVSVGGLRGSWSQRGTARSTVHRTAREKRYEIDACCMPYLQLSDAGPMTYAMLPVGKYRITAQFRGRSETREVTLDGDTGRDVYFHWKGDAK